MLVCLRLCLDITPMHMCSWSMNLHQHVGMSKPCVQLILAKQMLQCMRLKVAQNSS